MAGTQLPLLKQSYRWQNANPFDSKKFFFKVNSDLYLCTQTLLVNKLGLKMMKKGLLSATFLLVDKYP